MEDKNVKTNPEVKINTEQIGRTICRLNVFAGDLQPISERRYYKRLPYCRYRNDFFDGTVVRLAILSKKLLLLIGRERRSFLHQMKTGLKIQNRNGKKTAKDIDTENENRSR